MAKSKRLPDIFDLCRVLRDNYRQKYDQAVEARDEKIKYAKGNYISNSPALKTALEDARTEFKQTVEELKAEARNVPRRIERGENGVLISALSPL